MRSILLLTTILSSASLALGDRARGADAVDQTREVLTESGKIPWYDPQADELRPIKPRPQSPPDDPLRRSTWEAQTNPAAPKKPAAPGAVRGGGSISPLLQFLGIALLTALLVIVTLLLLFRAQLQKWTAFTELEEEAPGTSIAVDQIDALPVPVRSADGDLLAEARRQYEAGDYGSAIIYLFSYQLLQLDRHHMIRLAKGKTNRKYLREVQRTPELRGLLERTMIAFEDVFFGRHQLERERFEACWAGLDEFHRRLEQAPA